MATRKIVNKHINQSSSTYVGVDGELFYDTATNTLKISDGSTPGGVTLNTDGAAVSLSDTFSVTVTSTDSGSPQPITWSSNSMHVVLLIRTERSGSNSNVFGQLTNTGSFAGQLLTVYHESSNNNHNINLVNLAGDSLFGYVPNINTAISCVYVGGQWRRIS